MKHALRAWSALGIPVVTAATVMTAMAEPAAPSSTENGPRLIALGDIAAIKWPGAPRVSPDGRQVVYALDDQVFVVAAGGGTPRAVTSVGSKASDPRWSRDGKALFFLSNRADKKYQVWKLPLDTFGEAQQLSDFDRGIETLNLSPDESQLLLTIRGKYEPPQAGQDQVSDAKGEADARPEKKPEPFVIDRLHFKEDAADGYITGDRNEHLYTYDFKTRALKQVTSGRYSESEGAWSPDGRRIVFASNRDPDPDVSYKADLWIVEAHNTDGGQSLARLTSDDWSKSAPAWSPDGRAIAYITAEDGVYGIQHVAIVPASGGATKVLTRGLDRWVNDFRFSSDGQWIYFVYEQLGGAHLARVRLSDGKLEKLLEGERQISAFDVSRTGAIAARIELMNDPAEIYSLVQGRVTKLSNGNDAFLATVARGSKESVEFSSRDGTRIQAFVTRPPGFAPGRKYPTLLHIHGGPVGQFAYGYDFSNQYLAANGYIVVEPNPRGSTGRGQSFIRAIYQSWGIADFDDLIAAVDHVIAQGYSDPDRLAVYGYSYGGYMTNWVIARSNRFKAAASGAGHSLIYANYGHDIYQKWYNWELGVPWENEEKYAKLSPLRHAGQVTTPTLFLGGRDDWNVPVINAELFYQSLKKRGIDTQLVVYPDTHHGGWSEEFEKDRLLRIHQWFDKYLQPGRARAQAP